MYHLDFFDLTTNTSFDNITSLFTTNKITNNLTSDIYLAVAAVGKQLE